MSSISRRVCVIRCRRPAGCGGSPGSVTSIRSSASRASSSAASSSAVRPPSSSSSASRTSFAALPDRPALLGRQLADRAQRRGQLRLAAEVAHPQLLELGRLAAAAIAASASAADRSIEVSHRRPSYVRARTAPRSRPSPRSASRAVVADGCAPALAARSASGKPSPLGAHQQTRRGRRARARAASRSARRVEREPSCRRSSSSVARAGGRAKIEPMLARTALGEYGSAQPGPSTTGPSAERVRRADDRADVARVLDAVEVDRAGRPPGSAQRSR